MATKLTFQFKNQGTPQVIILDATPQEMFSSAADITDFPVEAGSNVTDNIRRKPIGLTIDGVVTDFPLQNSGAASSPSSGSPGLQRPATSSSLSKSKNALQLFEQLQEDGVVFKVETGLKEYQNMALAGVDVTRDNKTKNAVRAKLTMKSVKIVQSQTVNVTKVSTAQAQPVSNNGKQTPTKPNAASQEKAKSLLSGAIDFAKSKLH